MTADPPGYAELFAAQGGTCAICWKPPPEGRRLNRDHDHKTGALRGLLCVSCNRYVIGRRTRDTAYLLERAASYLQWPPAEQINLEVDMGTGPVRKKKRKRG